MEYLNIFTYILLVMTLGWYLITNLQWYNYKIERVIFKHHKQHWHILYFVSPIVLFYLLEDIYFNIYFYILYLSSFILWNNKLDRSLVLTLRVKRFLAILLLSTFILNILYFFGLSLKLTLFIPLFITFIISTLLEKMFFISFKHQAKRKIKNMKDLKIVAITASYGKTSIKNYLHQVIRKKFISYKTPRSVNTIGGIVLDVNKDLPLNTQVYIAEAGARVQGDIEEVTMFLEPQYCIIGSVGEQHLEYFKTLDNIIHTKMELLSSPRMIKAFVHDTVPILKYDTITKFPNNLNITKSTLDGIWFDLIIDEKVEHFHAPILGSFNAINLSAVILMAKQLGMSLDEIKIALDKIQAVPHRLQKILAGGKIIIDDSFNGNLEGMLEAVKISSTHQERKVIITPGLVEATLEANITFAKAVNEIFDLVIITGSLNKKVLLEHIDESKTEFLNDKTKMEKLLAEKTFANDLILFANDAPNFI